MNLTRSIIEHLATLPEGTTVGARELLHLGTRAGIDQALSRLAARGQLLRAARGVYVLPVTTRFGNRPPSVEKVVEAFAATRGETIAAHGAAAANALGLTTQVPVRTIFLTSGLSRTLELGSRSVELRHTPLSRLALAGSAAGNVIRALEWMGPEAAPGALPELSKRLPAEVLAAVRGARSQMPTWLAEQVSRTGAPNG